MTVTNAKWLKLHVKSNLLLNYEHSNKNCFTDIFEGKVSRGQVNEIIVFIEGRGASQPNVKSTHGSVATQTSSRPNMTELIPETAIPRPSPLNRIPRCHSADTIDCTITCRLFTIKELLP